nr:hypothetical protein [Tanacetum cinerariifolium]
MEPLTFADTHNMVTFLSKSDASDGFDHIVDFLNTHTIKYALMVNPTIYVVVTKAIIRRDLHLDDADGVECLLNAKIFKELARMGYEKPPLKLTFYKEFFFAQWKFLIHIIVQCISAKRTAWNEFSSSMEYVVIYLATGGKIAAIDADEGTTLANAETDEEEVALDAEILYEKIAQKLDDKEVQKVAARDEQERADIENAIELQRQLDERQDYIDWSAVAEQVKERQSNSIKRYQDLKKKPVLVAQARKNMMIHLKNMQDKDVQKTKKKRVTDDTLLQESFKKLRAAEVLGSESTQEIPTDDLKEITEDDVQNMLEIVPVQEFRVEALQVKYPIID